MILYIVLALVVLQRVVELLYAARNTRRLIARGGIESGAVQYPLFILLHAAWLASMAIFIPPSTIPNWYLIGLYVLLQPFRIWTIASLGPYWTTRIITLAGTPRVRRGPYRIFRHPNYVIVCAEIAILPLAFGSREIAILFSFLNAALLSWRIRIEERALLRAERSRPEPAQRTS